MKHLCNLLVTYLLLASASLAASPAKQSRNQRDRLGKALCEETMPTFDLKEATFDEAFENLRHQWDLHHPRESFPVAPTDLVWVDHIAALMMPKSAAYLKGQDGTWTFTPPKMTLHLEDASYITALRYIATLSYKRIANRSGVLEYAEKLGLLDNAKSQEHEISPAALSRLKLRTDATPDEVRAAWKRLGIRTPEWTHFELTESGRRLNALCLEPDQEKIMAILTIFDSGHDVTK